MEIQGPPMDMMSKLPSSIIQTILALMPMRDAFRTSILSQSWKYHCVNIHKLMFDDKLFQGSANQTLSIICKLLGVIYPILLSHKCHVLVFSLCFNKLSSCCEIDLIILHLSKKATVKAFALSIETGDGHKLLPPFFMLQQLEDLKLRNCAFQPPATFQGFRKLISIYFDNVTITTEVLLRFISNCPLLEDFTLLGDEKHLMGLWNSNFFELFKCLPSVEIVYMNSYPIQCFFTGVTPQKLPASLVPVKCLGLSGVCFAKENELRSTLLFVTSFPVIEEIIMEMNPNPTESVPQPAMNFFYRQDYSYVILDHLQYLTIINFTNMKPLMDFVKLFLDKSPMLVLVRIVIEKRVVVDDEVKMLKELIQYPWASVRAKIKFERP